MKYTLKQKAYNFLYDAILTNVYPPGTPLVEHEISTKLGISRTPVREAFKQLESEGLIKYYPAKGTFVAEISTQDVEEILELREVLEILALRLSIDRISMEQLEEVEEKLKSLDEGSSPDEFYECDRALHRMLFENSGNKRLTAYMSTLNAQIERLRSVAAMKSHRLSQSRQEHLLIVQAMKRRNLKEAERYLGEHIRNVAIAIVDVCRNQGYLMKGNDSSKF